MSSTAALAARLLELCRAQGMTLSTAESCTGGMTGAAITEIPGSSEAYLGGFITYSNQAKRQLLGVAAATLEAHGAVSEPVAAQMAAGARRALGATLAVSVTGIAGPGGSEHKPEGRVCFGLAHTGGIATQTVDFGALGRARVRTAATRHALELLVKAAQADSDFAQ